MWHVPRVHRLRVRVIARRHVHLGHEDGELLDRLLGIAMHLRFVLCRILRSHDTRCAGPGADVEYLAIIKANAVRLPALISIINGADGSFAAQLMVHASASVVLFMALVIRIGREEY